MDLNLQTIVITSIFHPTAAVKRFASLSNYHLIVVGDLKTPKDWECDGVQFLAHDDQQDSDWALGKLLPSNHYCRKMLGYLEAMKIKSDIIIDTDDDNLPYNDWSFPEFDGDFETVGGPYGFINVYQLFTDQHIWPRGLPLSLITTDFQLEKQITKRASRVGVWQALADDDPDVDAIYRLTSDTPCQFRKREPLVLAPGVISPFNSQNTAFRRELFPLLYLPCDVTFRFTDILRGIVAQPIMSLYGFSLGFTSATVRQERNPHDYIKDFESEIPMYQHTSQALAAVESVVSAEQSVDANLLAAYDALCDVGITTSREMVTVKAWVQDCNRIAKKKS